MGMRCNRYYWKSRLNPSIFRYGLELRRNADDSGGDVTCVARPHSFEQNSACECRDAGRLYEH